MSRTVNNSWVRTELAPSSTIPICVPLGCDRWLVQSPRRVCFWLALILAVPCHFPHDAWAQSVPQASDEIARWVKQLGASSYSARQRARLQLIKLGAPALPALERASRMDGTSDLEIQLAAQRIQQTIQIELRSRQIDRFLAKQEDLAWWPEFSDRYGDTDANRKLIAEMHRTQGEFLRTAKLQPLDELQLISAMAKHRISHLQEPEKALAALLTPCMLWCLAPDSSESIERIPLQQRTQLISMLVRPSTIQLIRNSEHRATCLQLLHDLFGPLLNQTSSRSQVLSGMLVYRDPAFAPLLTQILSKPKLPVALRALAVRGLAESAPEDVIKTLETWIQDTSIVGHFLMPSDSTAEIVKDSSKNDGPAQNRPPISEVQLGDLCLLACCILENRSPEDFGFAPACVKDQQLQIKYAGFSKPAERQVARQRWSQRPRQNSISSLANPISHRSDTSPKPRSELP